MSSPRFPPELERVVFESALENRIQDATNLFLVSKRVQLWLTPKAFSVVFLIPWYYFPTKFTVQKFQKYGGHIRHICVGDAKLYNDDGSHVEGISKDNIIDKCLSFCPNLVNFVVRFHPSEVRIQPDTLTRLSSLRSLSFNPLRLVGSTAPHWVSPFFPNISHLDIVQCPGGELEKPTVHDLLAFHFPSLTHFALCHYREINTVETLLSLLDRRRFPRLEVLILWKVAFELAERKPGDPDWWHRMLPSGLPTDEKRIVVINQGRKDWEIGTNRKGLDMWSLAEGIVKERMMGV